MVKDDPKKSLSEIDFMGITEKREGSHFIGLRGSQPARARAPCVASTALVTKSEKD